MLVSGGIYCLSTVQTLSHLNRGIIEKAISLGVKYFESLPLD